MKKNRPFTKIYFPAMIASLLWASSFSGVKIGLKTMSPFLFAGVRFFLAGILVIFFFLFSVSFNHSKIKKALPSWKVTLSIAFLQTFLMYGFYYIGLDWVSGAVSAVVMGSSPLFAAVVSHFTLKNDRLTIKKIIALVMGLAGIILISVSRDFSLGTGWMQIPGILFLVAAMIVSSFSNVIVKKYPVASPLLMNGFQLILGGFLLILLAFIDSLIRSTSLLRVSAGEISISFFAVLFWLSLVSAVAFSIWYQLLKYDSVKVSELNLWKFLIPACGAALAWWIVPGETVDVTTLIGMGVVSFSIIFYFLQRQE